MKHTLSLSLALLMTVLLAQFSIGCTNEDNNSNAGGSSPTAPASAPVNAPAAAGPYGYKIDGKNDQGQECTTGVKNFDSLRLMCLNIQDQVQNSDCALHERITKFMEDCWPEGYGFYESRTCRITLLDKKANLTHPDKYDSKDVIKSQDLCIGRTLSGPTIAGLHFGGVSFHDNILLSANMTFVADQDKRPDRRSNVDLKLYRRENNGKITYLVEDFNYKDGQTVATGVTRDSEFQYVIQCNHTWVCDAK